MTAYEELYKRHAPRLYSLACRMLDNAADAEDALQESFLQVFRKIGSFKGESQRQNAIVFQLGQISA